MSQAVFYIVFFVGKPYYSKYNSYTSKYLKFRRTYVKDRIDYRWRRLSINTSNNFGVKKMEKYGFIYIWYDTNHKKYYIGSHWGQINDRYICSSKWMKKAYKNRPSEFKRRILESGIKKNKLKANEYRWLSMIKDEELGKRYYNLNNKKILKPGNWPTGRTRSEETKQKISEALKGNTPWNKGVPMSNDQKEKLRLINLGKGHSEDTKKRVSLSLIGNKRRSGKLHSTEDLEKMSKSQKKIWDNNSERKKQQSIRMKQYWENYRNRKKENNE